MLCLPISHLLKIIDFSLSSECTLLICCVFNCFVILYFFKCCVVPVSHDLSITWRPFCLFFAVLLFCVHFYYDEQLMLLFLGLFKLCISLWAVLCLPISHLLEIIDLSLSSECTLWICCFFNSFVILYFFKCCVVPVSHDFSITWWLLQEPFCCFVFTFTMMNS